MDIQQQPTTRAIPVKILYTFDNGLTTFISRSPTPQDIKVVYTRDQHPLGIIDVALCLQCISESSPEIISNLKFCDYAVYSTDYSETELPLVGHGMFSWIYLMASDKHSQTQPVFSSVKEQLMARNRASSMTPSDEVDVPTSRLSVGRICTNILSLFSGTGRETLEVRLKFVQVENFTQEQYIASINLYRTLGKILPKNFDHPSWMNLVTQHNLLERYLSSAKTIISREDPITNRLLNTSTHTKHSNYHMSHSLTNKKPGPDDHLAKRQRSESPSPPTKNTSDSDMTLNLLNSLGPSSSLYLSEPNTSPIMSSNYLETDISICNSSPVSQMSFTKQVGQALSSTSEPSRLIEEPYTPNPNSISQSPFSDSNNLKSHFNINGKSSTQPSKRKKQRKLNVKETPEIKYCENCGQLETTAWRRIGSNINGVEKEFHLCNPCGIWLQNKGSMRPMGRWGKEKENNNHTENESLQNSVLLTPAPSSSTPATSNFLINSSNQKVKKTNLKKTAIRLAPNPVTSEGHGQVERTLVSTNIAEMLAANSERKKKLRNSTETTNVEVNEAVMESSKVSNKNPNKVSTINKTSNDTLDDLDSKNTGNDSRFISIAPKNIKNIAKAPVKVSGRRTKKSDASSSDVSTGTSPSDPTDTQLKRVKRKYTKRLTNNKEISQVEKEEPSPKEDDSSDLKSNAPEEKTAENGGNGAKVGAGSSLPIQQLSEYPTTPKCDSNSVDESKVTTPIKLLQSAGLTSPNISPSSWIKQLFPSPGNKKFMRKTSPLPNFSESSELDKRTLYSESAIEPFNFHQDVNFEELAREIGIVADFHQTHSNNKLDLVPFFEMPLLQDKDSLQEPEFLSKETTKLHEYGENPLQKNDETASKSRHMNKFQLKEQLALRHSIPSLNDLDQVVLDAPKGMTLPSSPPRPDYNNNDDWSDNISESEN